MPDCTYCGKEMEFNAICLMNSTVDTGYFICTCGSRSKSVEMNANSKNYSLRALKQAAESAAQHRHFEIDYNRADAWVEKLLNILEHDLTYEPTAMYRECYNNGEDPE